VALFTTVQRVTSNDERAPVLSVMEGVIGMGAVAGGLLAPVLLFVFGNRGGLVVAGLLPSVVARVLYLPVIAVILYLRIGQTRQVGTVQESTVRLLRQVPMFAELPMTAVE